MEQEQSPCKKCKKHKFEFPECSNNCKKLLHFQKKFKLSKHNLYLDSPQNN